MHASMASKPSGLLNLVDETLDLVDEKKSEDNSKMLIFITGRSASGKTTLGEAFKSLDDFIHFDGDQFSHGNDAVLCSGQVIDGKHKVKRSKKLEESYMKCMKDGYEALFSGKSPDLSAWTPFYSLLCAEVKRMRGKYADKHVVVTHAIYLRSIRDLIRETLGEEVLFIILNPPVNVLGDRAVKRVLEYAKKAKQTPQQYLHGWGIDLDEIHGMTVRNSKGFELKQKDEANSLQIDIDAAMTPEDVFKAAKQSLSL